MPAAAAVLLVVLAVTWLSAPTAAAGPASRQSIELVRFQLETGDSYFVSFEATRRQARLTVEKHTSNGLSIATYRARGTVGAKRVTARFGRFGSVSVAFRPRGLARSVRPPEGCNGFFAKGRRGTFAGQIRFVGEGGYVDLDARRASGLFASSKRWSCPPRRDVDGWGRANDCSGDDGRAAECAMLVASTPGERREFFALGLIGAPELPIFGASMKERTGQVRIARHAVVAYGPPDAFRFDHELGAATVGPPEPFDGTASFQRSIDGSKTWAGDLTVSFLGHDGVSLTGSRFDPHLSARFPGD